MADAAASGVLERFRNIEPHFNTTFLKFLAQFQQMFTVVKPENDHEKLLASKLDKAYSTWFYKIKADQRTLDACTRMHETITPTHALLMARDTQLLHVKGDLLSALFDCPDLDTPYLYSLLAEDPNPAEDERLAFWDNLLNLYRIAALICIYAKNTQVKDIIDMILETNPNVAGGNLAHNITGMFKSNKRLRGMIMGLMNGKQAQIPEIFNSLKIVLSTLVDQKPGSAVPTTTAMTADQSTSMACMLVTSIVPEFKSWTEQEQDRLVQAIKDKDDLLWSTFATRISPDQRKAIETLYDQRGNQNLGSMMKDVNGTMAEFMKAMESNDESAMESMMERTSALMNLSPDELKEMEAEMQALATEDSKTDE